MWYSCGGRYSGRDRSTQQEARDSSGSMQQAAETASSRDISGPAMVAVVGVAVIIVVVVGSSLA